LRVLLLSPESAIESLDSLVRADFINLRDLFFSWLLRSTAIVGIGVLLEVFELLHEIRPVQITRIDFSTGLLVSSSWRKSVGRLIKAVALLGWFMVLIGVVGEGVFESLVSRADGDIQTFDSILLASTQRRAAEANERASANEQEAKQLQKEAEDERMARLEIEARVAWRNLTKKQQSEIGATLRRFPGITARESYADGEPEESMFASDICLALRAADWAAFSPDIRPTGGVMMMNGDPNAQLPRVITGVRVEPTDDVLTRKAAGELIVQLKKRGFDASLGSLNPNPPGRRLFVSVERRPNGPQGEAQLRAKHRLR